MRAFKTYIEYLLMTRHYCYVPGRGAYMMVEEDASIDATPCIGKDCRRVHKIEAPHRIVRFNALHTHDDGMLANLLMEAEGMTYDEATRYIERQASLLPDDFEDKASLDTDTENFGFEALLLETWVDIEARMHPTDRATVPTTPQRANTETIAIPKYWIKRAAIVLLIGIFFFTNFIGLNQGNVQLASILNPRSIQSSFSQQNCEVSDESDSSIETTAVSPEVSDTKLCADHNDTETEAEDKKYQNQNLAAEDQVTRYFIIVECTKSEDTAHKVCERYRKRGFDNSAIMATPSGVYRIFIEQYTDLREAANRLRSLRKADDRLHSAWLMPLEGGSLSSIIKNKNNDNQLSLELSHPNSRTERDQG